MKAFVALAFATCAIATAIVYRIVTAGQQMESRAVLPLKDVSRGKVYSDGPFEVDYVSVEAAEQLAKKEKSKNNQQDLPKALDSPLPPRPILVAVPVTAGKFPVVQLQHGFSLKNEFYRQLMGHVASHGFIVVAPQMYNLTVQADTAPEMEAAAALLDWLPVGLLRVLPKDTSAKPDISKVALIGHSRGGKVAFGVALGIKKSSVKLSAIVGLDPVDGKDDGVQTPPKVLKYLPHSFKLPFPTLLVGAGLGGVRKNIFFPACVPRKVGHDEFFSDSGPPAYHFVAKEFGHMDFLDDKCHGVIGRLSGLLCKNGPRREPMRRFAGGLVIAFLKFALLRDVQDFRDALTDPNSVPIAIEKPQSYEKERIKRDSFVTLGTPLDVLA